ncbi:PREDICTED: uncharacterized protein LOC104612010 [Nelumbo nucifera]|uniref:Uncharacterized protein LOC104612010 n=1 Tax=Nelumbo nucifera TaxID=4432 RepID=A0A1U8BL17_NELNU|nr:PREDICTED: uncharacterized protein LOC104612010 [Nelumbo nucifera]
MVQRKSPNKLGIQAASQRHDKAEKRSTTLKPSPTQNHDMRSRGAELKKKIKKSRSLKRSDLESLGSSPVTPAKLRHQKPAMEESSPSVIKMSGASPNYMKPTSSSDAKKEQRLQVSPSTSQTSNLHGRSSSRRNSNYSKHSGSGHKPATARTLAKQSSLKPVRTLAKTSSLKTSRPSMKKSSRVSLCPSVDVDRATCSSTLKDSKFPACLTLSPGGTEAEGTSVFKVCPYTYCSLNGHYHAPVPPLKRFLSMRRRLLKTQKSLRLRGLSKTSGARVRDPAIQEADLAGLAASPMMEEVDTDYFVEIYAKPREETVEIMLSDRGGSEMDVENDDKSLLDESPYSEISFEDGLDYYSEFLQAEMDNQMTFPEQEQLIEVENEDYRPCLIKEVSPAETVSETSDMDLEEEQVVVPNLDNGSDDSNPPGKEPNPVTLFLTESKDPGLHSETTFKPNGIFSDYRQEVPEDGELRKIYEENEHFSEELGDSGSESNFGDDYLEGDISSEISVEGSDASQALIRDIFSSTEDEIEEPTVINGENNEVPVTNKFISSMISAELEESTTSTEEKNGDSQLDDNISNVAGEPVKDVVTEDLVIEEESKPQLHELEDADSSIKTQISKSFDSDEAAKSNLSLSEAVLGAHVGSRTEDKVQEDCDANHQAQTEIEACQLDVTTEDDKGVHLEIQDHSSDNQSDMSNTVEVPKFPEKDDQQLLKDDRNLRGKVRSKKPTEDEEELRKFNPRDPRFLPLEPEPDAEKVDLRHQMMDERKNAEEWMLDYALQQVVKKLAPTRSKRRVSVLVQAFEAVSPEPKFETASFSPSRVIQACS